MDNKDHIEEQLHIATTALDKTLILLEPYQLGTDHSLPTNVKEALGNLVVALMHFENSKERFRKPISNCCSFCKKNEQDVSILIQGPNVWICNECIEKCKDVVDSRKHDK